MDSCPSCSTPLTLFTTRERIQHINVCLDSKKEETDAPTCAVCHRNLNLFTPVARQEHVNKCLDVRKSDRRQPQPVRKRPRSTGKTCSRIPQQTRQHRGCDEKVVKLLTILGLERYAQRFAEEEIDFDTLRILKDEDLVSLRIPDAARRRVADAMHAVPILERLQATDQEEQIDEPLVIPTQQFATSTLGAMLRRRSSLFVDDDDDCYRPTQTAVEDERKSPEHCSNAGSPRMGSPHTAPREIVPVTVDLVTPTKDDDVGLNEVQPSEKSSESELDFERDILEESQISLEFKIERWRNHQIRKETKRHQDEIKRIETRYQGMLERLTGTCKSPMSSLNPDLLSSGPKNASTHNERVGPATIDLTTELSDDSKEPTKETDGTVGKRAESTEKACDAANTNEDDLLDCCSDSEEDFVIERTQKSPPRGFKSLLPDLNFESESDGYEDLNQRERLGSTKLLLRGKACCEDPNEHRRRSNDEILDLLDEDNPKEGAESRGTVSEELFVISTGADSSSSEGEKHVRRSMLKRKKTVTREEITRAIRKDESLYDHILKMESISFETILQSIRKSGTPVSRKALTNYLHSEGVMYKGETVSKSSRAYLNGLNSGF